MTSRTFGIIGLPLKHSFSKKYFTEKFEKEGIRGARYEQFELTEIEELEGVLKDNRDLRGLNVTIPYKEQVFKFLDEVDPRAQRIGAVNVIKVIGDQLKGYNSDYYGFRSSLEKWLGKDPIDEALVLGTGGASKAVKCVLQDMGIRYKMVSRSKSNGDITYSELKSEPFARAKLIVNTTPVGTFPRVEDFPDIPYSLLSERHYLYDLVYNPAETGFMKKGLERGAQAKNGYEMLVLQAEKSWEIWNDL